MPLCFRFYMEYYALVDSVLHDIFEMATCPYDNARFRDPASWLMHAAPGRLDYLIESYIKGNWKRQVEILLASKIDPMAMGKRVPSHEHWSTQLQIINKYALQRAVDDKLYRITENYKSSGPARTLSPITDDDQIALEPPFPLVLMPRGRDFAPKKIKGDLWDIHSNLDNVRRWWAPNRQEYFTLLGRVLNEEEEEALAVDEVSLYVLAVARPVIFKVMFAEHYMRKPKYPDKEYTRDLTVSKLFSVALEQNWVKLITYGNPKNEAVLSTLPQYQPATDSWSDPES